MDDDEATGLFHVTAWHGDLGDLVARARSMLDVRRQDVEAPRTLHGRDAVAADFTAWLDAFAGTRRPDAATPDATTPDATTPDATTPDDQTGGTAGGGAG